MLVWSPQQNEALEAVRKWIDFGPSSKQIFRLFGYAGTGKTTLAIEIAQMVSGRCMFASFTGKAALVMRRKGCAGAKTIHSLIYTVREDEGEEDEPLFVLNKESELVDAKLLIIDECSMVDEQLATDLLSFRVPILVLGDPMQLPPIAGAGFFTNGEPDVMLTEIHRQADGNPIIHIATEIRKGNVVKFGNYKGAAEGEGVSVIRRADLTRNSVLRADQIICGRNDTRVTINRKMRGHLRAAGKLPESTDHYPVIGDRVICLRNNREKGLFNGGIWSVKQLLLGKPSPDGTVKKKGRDDVIYAYVDSLDEAWMRNIPIAVPHAFWFWNNNKADLKLPEGLNRRTYDEFDYAYAITCHKSQGSQWDKIIIYDERHVFGRGDDAEEMSKRWAYTAVTRAAKACIIAV